ncbi:MAG: LysR family transcriptional regulator [Chloroflexi bacterium]|nr:LysR family transcriptional regulator [Chloroflexota bacterium]
MELRQLGAFRHVALYQSFSKAAEALFLTQPTVTARIQALERELGASLFERKSRGVRLTEAGKALLPYAERIAQSVEEGRHLVEKSRRGPFGKLHIGAARAIGTYVLPKALKPFQARHPETEIVIRTGRSQDVLNMLLAADVEIGFARALQHPEIETMHLYDEEIILVTHPEHPFTRTRKASVAEIAREPLILYDRESTYYILITNACREAGIIPNVTMELDSIEATKKMVELGLGISLLPVSSLERELELGTLVHIRISDGLRVHLPTAVLYRKTRRLSDLVRAFLADVQGFAPQSPDRKRPLRIEGRRNAMVQ